MLVIPGRRCHTCEGPTRRELLRAGSIGMLGLNLAHFLAWQKTANAAAKYDGARGFGVFCQARKFARFNPSIPMDPARSSSRRVGPSQV